MIPNNKKFKLYKSQLIIDNQKEFIQDIYKAAAKHHHQYPNKNLTFNYEIYNTFSITAPSILFYKLFEELKTLILNHVKSDFIWINCWINIHDCGKTNRQNTDSTQALGENCNGSIPEDNTVEKVLDWHSHKFPFSGYISIDPHKTRTVFENRNSIEGAQKMLREEFGDSPVIDEMNSEIVEFEIKNEIGNIYIGPGHIQHKVFIDEDFDTPRITLGFDVVDEKIMKERFGFSSLIPLTRPTSLFTKLRRLFK